MTSLSDIRKQYPQYEDVSDGDLLIGLQRKFYPDMHPRQFLNSIEGGQSAHVSIRNPELKAWYRERVTQPLPDETPQQTETRLYGDPYSSAESGGRLQAGLRSFAQGQTFGYGDEIVGNLRALTSGNSPEYEVGMERARLAKGEEKYPTQSTLAEIGGAFAMPGAAAAKPSQAIALGTAGGMAYASGKAEGGGAERSTAAVNALPQSLLFSAGATTAQRLMSGALKKLAGRVQEKPSTGSAKRLRDAAYDAVDNSGFRFTRQEFDDALTEVYRRLESPDSAYVKGDPKVERALKVLEKNWDRDLTLSQVDNVRKRLMKTWAAAGPDEADSIMDMVSVIDDLIENSGGGPTMQAAREAHKTYMRLDMLEKAFEKASNNTSVTGSGGNTYNNYARVFKNILSDERKARMFTPEMRQFMQKAIDTPASEAALRKLGKLSPDGNGLMLALSVIGGSIEPSSLAAFGMGAGAKAISDRKMLAHADDMMRLAAGLPPKAPTVTPTQIPTAAAIAGQQD